MLLVASQSLQVVLAVKVEARGAHFSLEKKKKGGGRRRRKKRIKNRNPMLTSDKAQKRSDASL